MTNICVCGSQCAYIGLTNPVDCTNPKCKFATPPQESEAAKPVELSELSVKWTVKYDYGQWGKLAVAGLPVGTITSLSSHEMASDLQSRVVLPDDCGLGISAKPSIAYEGTANSVFRRSVLSDFCLDAKGSIVFAPESDDYLRSRIQSRESIKDRISWWPDMDGKAIQIGLWSVALQGYPEKKSPFESARLLAGANYSTARMLWMLCGLSLFNRQDIYFLASTESAPFITRATHVLFYEDGELCGDLPLHLKNFGISTEAHHQELAVRIPAYHLQMSLR